MSLKFALLNAFRPMYFNIFGSLVIAEFSSTVIPEQSNMCDLVVY